MAERISPTFNDYQLKIITVLAVRGSCEKAKIIKQGVAELIGKFSEVEIRAMLLQYDKLTPEQKQNPEK